MFLQKFITSLLYQSFQPHLLSFISRHGLVVRTISPERLPKNSSDLIIIIWRDFRVSSRLKRVYKTVWFTFKAFYCQTRCFITRKIKLAESYCWIIRSDLKRVEMSKFKMLKSSWIRRWFCAENQLIISSLQVEFYRNEVKLINCQKTDEINHSSQNKTSSNSESSVRV